MIALPEGVLLAKGLPVLTLIAPASLSRQVDCGWFCGQLGCPRSAGSPPAGLRIARLLVIQYQGRLCSIFVLKDLWFAA
jgi:hypothetical protein